MDEYLKKIIPVIREAIKRKKTTADKASIDAVGNFTLIRNIKAGRVPSISNMKKLCDVLGLDMYIGFPEDYQRLKKVALLGGVAGEAISANHDLTKLDDAELENCEQIPSPVNTGSMIAFAISDNALSPIFSEGDVIFADLADKSDPSQWEKFIGKICIVQLQNEKNLLRILRRGDNPDTFNFESLIKEPTLTNQSPKICLPVCWISKL